MTADIKIQRGTAVVSADGETATLPEAVASLANAFLVMTNNRMTGAGASNANVEGDDLSVQGRLTGVSTITWDRPATTPGTATTVYWEVWEYVGAPGGDNEFLVRSRDELTENSGADTATLTVTPTSIDRCIPFITGAMTSETVDGANGLSVRAWLSGVATLNGAWGEDDAATKTMHVTTVEFTGSNWVVGHGTTQGATADTGTIALVTGADGATGSSVDVGDWGTAALVAWGHAGDGTNQAIADHWPLLEPAAGTEDVAWTFDSNHDGTDDDYTVHVLGHADLVVTRYSSTTQQEGGTNIDITSAGLTDLGQASILGTSITSGTGSNYSRGWRNYRLTSLTNAEHWCSRFGNTMQHRLVVIDWTGVATAATGPGSVAANVLAAPASLHTGAVAVGGVAVAADLLAAPAAVPEGAVAAGAAQVAAELVAAPAALLQGTVAAGVATVAADVLAAPATLHDGTVGQGAVALVAHLLTAPATIYQGTVAAGFANVAALLVAAPAAVPQGSVAAGTQYVTAAVVTGNAAVLATGVAYQVSANLLAAPAAVHTGAVLADQALAALVVAAPATIYQGTLPTGAVAVAADLLAAPATVHTAALVAYSTVAAQAVAAPASVHPGAATTNVAALALAAPPTVHTGAVAPGTYQLAALALAAPATVPAADVVDAGIRVAATLVSAPASVPAGQVNPGPVSMVPPAVVAPPMLWPGSTAIAQALRAQLRDRARAHLGTSHRAATTDATRRRS